MRRVHLTDTIVQDLPALRGRSCEFQTGIEFSHAANEVPILSRGEVFSLPRLKLESFMTTSDISGKPWEAGEVGPVVRVWVEFMQLVGSASFEFVKLHELLLGFGMEM